MTAQQQLLLLYSDSVVYISSIRVLILDGSMCLSMSQCRDSIIHTNNCLTVLLNFSQGNTPVSTNGFAQARPTMRDSRMRLHLTGNRTITPTPSPPRELVMALRCCGNVRLLLSRSGHRLTGAVLARSASGASGRIIHIAVARVGL